jgi:adenosylhomocysteine nucleosidase
MSDSGSRRVVVLGPMPLEMDAIVAAFGLTRASEGDDSRWTGRLGNSDVTAIHIGMGPTLTRAATAELFESGPRPDHVMIAGICGGLDPDRPVGTLINPEVVVLQTSGVGYRHTPPGNAAIFGKLITTEGVTLDPSITEGFFADGYIAVDMESAAVAEVCEANGCPWSVYRCISDRPFDGLLDDRVVALTNPDGTGNVDEIMKLIAAEPELAGKLEQLSRDTTEGARLAAEAAARGCLALDD